MGSVSSSAPLLVLATRPREPLGGPVLRQHANRGDAGAPAVGVGNCCFSGGRHRCEDTLSTAARRFDLACFGSAHFLPCARCDARERPPVLETELDRAQVAVHHKERELDHCLFLGDPPRNPQRGAGRPPQRCPGGA